VHPKFDTGAAENLCRAALWPPLIYTVKLGYNEEIELFGLVQHVLLEDLHGFSEQIFEIHSYIEQFCVNHS